MKYFLQKINIRRVFEVALFAFVFLLPWQTIFILQKWELGTIGVFGFEILFFLVVFLFFLWYWKEKHTHRPAYFTDWLYTFSFLFLGYCFLSTFWSFEPIVAFFQALRLLELFLLIVILTNAPFCAVTATLWFIAGAIFQSILGIYQFLTQSTFGYKWLGLVSHPLFETGTSVIQSEAAGRWLRAYGAFPHPNVFGGYLVVSIIFTTLIWYTKPKKVWFSLLMALQVVAIFFTFSRSAWIALMIWFVGFFLYWLKAKEKKHVSSILHICIFVVSIFSICSALYFPLVKTRLMGESYHEVRSIEERIGGPKFALELWKTSPLPGVGVGNYIPAMFNLMPHQERWVFEPVHVVPLLVVTELGIVGILLLGIVAFLFIKRRQWNFFLGLGIVTLTPLLLLDHYLYSLPLGLLLLGCTFGLGRGLLHSLSPPSGEK